MGWEYWPIIGAIVGLIKRALDVLRARLGKKPQPLLSEHIVGTGAVFTAPATFQGPTIFIGSVYVDGLPHSQTPQVAELFNQGIACKRNLEYDNAVRLFRSALAMEPTPNEKAALLVLIGTCFLEQMRVPEAVGHFTEAERVTLDANDRRGLAAARTMLGMGALASGRLDDASNFMRNAATVAGEISDTDAEALTIRAAIDVVSGFIGIEQYNKSGQAECLKRAGRAFDTALRLGVELCPAEWRMLALTGRGLIAMLKRKIGAATETLREALAISREAGWTMMEAPLSVLLADIHRAKGEDDHALLLLRKALDIFVVLQNTDAIDSVRQRMEAIQEKRNRES